MRVWFRKIHCPSSICFSCKPSQQICTPPAVPATFDLVESRTVGQVDVTTSDQVSAEKDKQELVVVDGGVDGEKVDGIGVVLKSSIKRKVVDVEGEEARKKTVQWMDVAGKSLVHVKEFEASESEDTDSENENNGGCICAII